MKIKKCFAALALAVAMVTTVVPHSAFAADTHDASSGIPDGAIVHTYETTIYPNENGIGVIPAGFGSGGGGTPVRSYYPAETFTFSGVRRGADHVMDGNYMAYEVNITMADGTTNNIIDVMVQVRKYSGSGIVSSWHSFHPDGITHKVDWIPFTGGGTCYFQYANTSSGTASGPVTLTLTTYSWY